MVLIDGDALDDESDVPLVQGGLVQNVRKDIQDGLGLPVGLDHPAAQLDAAVNLPVQAGNAGGELLLHLPIGLLQNLRLLGGLAHSIHQLALEQGL